MVTPITTVGRLELIRKWKAPSTDAEAKRQDRAERMVREAIAAHEPFGDVRSDITVEAKGSYPNNTNVRFDSDVDIKVQLNDQIYYEFRDDVPVWSRAEIGSYRGRWTPALLRQEVGKALVNAFGSGVDDSHNVAFYVPPVPGSRPNVDVVPCFQYRQYLIGDLTQYHSGSIVHCRDGKRIVNWPAQQLANGIAKNNNTNRQYKFVVRVLKAVENELCRLELIEAVPSYFSECLIYNVPDPILKTGDLDDAVREALAEIYTQFGGRPAMMWEPNEIKPLFGPQQKWTVDTGRELIGQAWTYLGYGR
ncbi:hypothetical protein [Kitasatospora sp. NPDC050543]|uniref:hypothetical protein n=1 Tax=Kitasatospora sp. NPDC050543 TaxID=3364054 RepID=UPI0037B6E310